MHKALQFFFGKRESAFLIPGNINGINILQNATRALFLIFSNPRRNAIPNEYKPTKPSEHMGLNCLYPAENGPFSLILHTGNRKPGNFSVQSSKFSFRTVRWINRIPIIRTIASKQSPTWDFD